MLSKLIDKFKSMFEPISEQQKLEKFISAQNPTSVADVEHWIKIYDQRQFMDRSNNYFSYNL